MGLFGQGRDLVRNWDRQCNISEELESIEDIVGTGFLRVKPCVQAHRANKASDSRLPWQ
jgi:hypothetical protein